jgi:RNA polymerase sigma-70 factor (sigma-E family)
MPVDEESFRDFVTGSSRRLQHTAELLTGSAHDAQDVVQTVLTRMYLRWRRIEQDDPYGYARRAVINETTDRWRRGRHREISRDFFEQVSWDDHATAHAERDAVLRALRGLTERERVVVVLRYYEDLSEEQIAGLVGVAAGTVKSTASRALTKLRGELSSSREGCA